MLVERPCDAQGEGGDAGAAEYEEKEGEEEFVVVFSVAEEEGEVGEAGADEEGDEGGADGDVGDWGWDAAYGGECCGGLLGLGFVLLVGGR